MLWAMADLANVFSWSRSRAGMFEDCRRRYYYHYYGAWGGWDSNAPPDIRRLYVLKQLTGRQGWAGRTVHSAVELVLRVLHAGEELSEGRLIEDTVRRMRDEWRFSHRGGYRDRPKEAVALFEHEYGVEVPDQAWQILRDHVCRCLRNFHRLPLLADIRSTPRERWILIEDIRAFEFEGTPIYAAPDFGYWTREDRLALVDWKTGSPDPDGTAIQLGGYALYARDILDVAPERVDLLEVNLRAGEVTVHPWDDTRLGRDPRAAPALDPRHEGVAARRRREPGGAGGLRADRGAPAVPVVQLQGSLSAGAPGAGAVTGARRRPGSRAERDRGTPWERRPLGATAPAPRPDGV